MAAKKNFYAIRCGRAPETGEPVINHICNTWDEARRLVHGAPGAVYAGFVTRFEAETWLGEGKAKVPEVAENGTAKLKAFSPAENGTAERKTSSPASDRKVKRKAPVIGKSTGASSSMKVLTGLPAGAAKSMKVLPGLPADALCCYVDGSFNENIPNYGYGLLCVLDGTIVHSASGAGTNGEATSMRQIAGELLGAIQALNYAKKNGYANVIVLHDYLGVANHATGTWKRTNPFSVTYHDWMQQFFRDNPGMKVTFRKVPAHAGLFYNELADVLAKRSIGMIPDPAWLEKARTAGILGDD